MGTQQHRAWATAGPRPDPERLAAWKPIAAPEMLHDSPEPIEGTCIPRISLDCSQCHRSVVYCHIREEVIDSYVTVGAPRWVCPDCAGGAS